MQLEHLEPLKLKQDVQTRWNFVSYMLERLDQLMIPFLLQSLHYLAVQIILTLTNRSKCPSGFGLTKPVLKLRSWIQDLRKPVLASRQIQIMLKIFLLTSWWCWKHRNLQFHCRCRIDLYCYLSRIKTTTTSSSDSQQITPEVTGGNLWEHLDKRVLEFSSMENPVTSAILKMKQYIELPCLDRKARILGTSQNHQPRPF